MKYFLLVLSGIFFYAEGSAQKKFLKGYIVNNLNDTIQGYIEYHTWSFNPDKINFKKEYSQESTDEMSVGKIRAFVIPGLHHYEKYNCSITMDNTNLEELGVDVSYEKIEKEVFLKMIKISSFLQLMIYRDRIKERLYILQKDSTVPMELEYRIYYQSKNNWNVVKEEKYKRQLSRLIDIIQPDNLSLKSKIDYLPYSLLPIRNLLVEICGETTSVTNIPLDETPKNKVRVNYGMLAGIYLYDYVDYSSMKAANENSPLEIYISAILDVTPDKIKNNYFLRFELGFLSTNYKSMERKLSLSNNGYSIFENRFKQSFLFISPSINYNVFRATRTNIYLGVGVGYDIAFNTTKYRKEKAYDFNNVLIGEQLSGTELLKGTYAGLHFSGQLGGKINNRVLLNANYTLSLESPDSVKFIGFTIGYLF